VGIQIDPQKTKRFWLPSQSQSQPCYTRARTWYVCTHMATKIMMHRAHNFLLKIQKERSQEIPWKVLRKRLYYVLWNFGSPQTKMRYNLILQRQILGNNKWLFNTKSHLHYGEWEKKSVPPPCICNFCLSRCDVLEMCRRFVMWYNNILLMLCHFGFLASKGSFFQLFDIKKIDKKFPQKISKISSNLH
jgi:hypothetical protein